MKKSVHYGAFLQKSLCQRILLILNLLLLFFINAQAQKPLACPGVIQLSQVQICVGECLMATYVGTVAPGSTFTWSNACGIITNTNNAGPQTACFTSSGPCIITVVIQQPGQPPQTCTATAEVFPKPTVSFKGDVTICEGSSTNLQIMATGPNPHLITVSDGTNTTNYSFNGPTFTINVSPTVTTTYTITQAASGPCAPFFPNSTSTVTVAPAINASIAQIGDSLKVLPYWMLYDWYDCNNNSVNFYNYIYHPPVSGCYCCILTDPQSGCSEKVCINYVKECTLTCGLSFEHNICKGETAVFNYTGNAGPNATYNWLIDVPGNPGLHFIGPGPKSIMYSDTGCYKVSVTVMENGCTVQCSDTICVVSKNWTAQIGQLNGVLYAMPNDTNYTYEWHHCNDTTIIGTQQSFTPDSVNCYCVVITDENGCTGFSCIDYPIPCNLTCDFSLSDTICVGDSIVITYTGNATSSATFNWTIDLPGFPSAHFIGMGPIVIPYTVAGCYDVTLTVFQNNCIAYCQDSFCVKSKVWDGHVIQEVGTLIASPGGAGYTYIWHECNSQTVLSTSQVFTPSGPGCYCVEIIDKCGCRDTVCRDYPIPCNITCDFSFSDDSLCVGDSIVISYTGNADSSAIFNWLIDVPGNPGLHFIGPDPKVLTYDAVGCFHVSLTVMNNNCIVTCHDSFCVVEAPTADLCCDISGCDSCHVLTINLTGTAPWFVNIDDGSNINTVGPIAFSPYSYTVCSPDTTTYTLVGVTDANSGCNGLASGSATVIYVPRPIASINISGDTLCAEPANMFYGWYNCPAGAYFSLNQCVVVAQSGCYCVTISNSLDCVDSACVVLTETYNPKVNGRLLVYPIPSANELTIQYTDGSETPQYFEVVDWSGKLLKKITNPIKIADNTYTMDISAFVSGMYFLKVYTANGVNTSRFIKL